MGHADPQLGYTTTWFRAHGGADQSGTSAWQDQRAPPPAHLHVIECLCCFEISGLPVYRVRTVKNERIWENVIDANTGSVREKEISSSLRELDREDLGKIIALKSVKQELSDAVRIAEKAAAGSALAGGLMKQDGKLNFVVVIASGDRLKEVMLEPPRVGRQGTNRH